MISSDHILIGEVDATLLLLSSLELGWNPYLNLQTSENEAWGMSIGTSLTLQGVDGISSGSEDQFYLAKRPA